MRKYSNNYLKSLKSLCLPPQNSVEAVISELAMRIEKKEVFEYRIPERLTLRGIPVTEGVAMAAIVVQVLRMGYDEPQSSDETESDGKVFKFKPRIKKRSA